MNSHCQCFFCFYFQPGADPATANVHIANLFDQKIPKFNDNNNWEFYKIGKAKENSHIVEGSIFEHMQQKAAGNSSNLSKLININCLQELNYKKYINIFITQESLRGPKGTP